MKRLPHLGRIRRAGKRHMNCRVGQRKVITVRARWRAFTRWPILKNAQKR